MTPVIQIELGFPGKRQWEKVLSDKTKVLCKWTKKEYVKQLEEVKEIVSKPTHICKDCGRVANAKKWLCKPTKL